MSEEDCKKNKFAACEVTFSEVFQALQRIPLIALCFQKRGLNSLCVDFAFYLLDNHSDRHKSVMGYLHPFLSFQFAFQFSHAQSSVVCLNIFK